MKLDAVNEIAAIVDGSPICLAVTDSGGHLLYFQRNVACKKASIEIAIRKAKTAVMFNRNTSELSGTELGKVTDALFIAGGVVTAEYGVGVSGLLPQEDEEIANNVCNILAQ
jgi:glc operon protein GlcG